MQDDGINALIGSDATEATRFLTTLNEEPRLFLLDDPFDSEDLKGVLEVAESLRRLPS